MPDNPTEVLKQYLSASKGNVRMKRQTRIIVILLATCAILFGGNAGAERAIKIRSQFDGTTLQKKFSTGTNYALIIGINEYENHPNLKTAVNDADAVAKLLKEKYFFKKENIALLKDREATKDHIMQEFRDLVATKVKKGDNVFIYYAGHGWFDDILESGYWVTAEATKSPETFLENNAVYKVIAALDKKGVQHVLLVSDSCFSGSFTKDHRAIETDIDDRYFREKYGKPSRNILTSGGLEPVEDVGKGGHSIFAYYFLKTLKDNPHPYLSAKQLGVQVEELVTRNSTQTPISKFIHGVGDEGGQFFFINRKLGTPKVSPGPTTAKVQDSTELEKERKLLQQERLELERLKMEIERKKLEVERKRLEAEKQKLAYIPEVKTLRSVSLINPNDRVWEFGPDGMYHATGSKDSFAWSKGVFSGDIELSVDFEKESNNSEAIIVVFGNGEGWSHGCLIFNIHKDFQWIRAHTVYKGVKFLAKGPGITPGDKYNIKIRISKGTASMLVNGIQTLITTLPQDINKSGKIALFKYWGNPSSIFRNVTVRKIE